jgi:hypothetical protein
MGSLDRLIPLSETYADVFLPFLQRTRPDPVESTACATKTRSTNTKLAPRLRPNGGLLLTRATYITLFS